jgi:phage terminase large subunit-like protein
MDRGRKAMPVQNKACMERYIRKCQKRHQQKVRVYHRDFLSKKMNLECFSKATVVDVESTTKR